ncbi:MAG: MobF family relaxase, partial [Solirubrobacteraceae bacterium]
EGHARELVAAEYRHTTSRGVMEGDAPDPQLHSHVVVTSAVREDGRIAAVASRPIFRAHREVGAYYRAALAHELSNMGYAIEAGTGKEGRYFEIAGVPQGLRDAFSARTREVARAAEQFRARWGRAPERGELRELKLKNRRAKLPVTRGELQHVWSDTARGFGFGGDQVKRLRDVETVREVRGGLEDRVEARLTERAATFQPSEFRAVLLEQSVGEMAPRDALAVAKGMVADGRVLPLQGGGMTTLTVRAREQAIERRFGVLAVPADREVGEAARQLAAGKVAERLGAPLSHEQTHALAVMTGPERGAVLVGPAGTGKGVVIDAAARAEQMIGRETFGIAVSGSTAQRLGYDTPALARKTLTLDSLVARVEYGSLRVDADTTVYFDEAGMADTARLERLTEMIERTGAKLVVIGDAAQLPSIGAGGMFARLTDIAPSVELSNVRRTLDPDEQKAWADLRAGRSDRAMAHYQARGQLHIADTRDQAAEQAVQKWAALTKEHPVEQVALISDASNQEIHRLNARAQHLRIKRGELGEREAPVPGVHYAIREGDRIALIEQHRKPGQPRIENGSQGEILHIAPDGRVLIEFDVTGRQQTLDPQELGIVRLGYAQHIHRAQGATVTRTVVVTGGWQTAKETAYVEASRPRQGTDWYINRDELGTHGQDPDRIQRLTQRMQHSHAQTPSLTYNKIPTDLSHQRDRQLDLDLGINLPQTPSHLTPLPGLTRAIHNLTKAPPEPDRSR